VFDCSTSVQAVDATDRSGSWDSSLNEWLRRLRIRWPRARLVNRVFALTFTVYLEENAGAVDLKLSDDDVARLEAALRPEAVSGSRYNEKIMAGVDR
jgi:diketogulonate reductase-like aldo/keto reductase